MIACKVLDPAVKNTHVLSEFKAAQALEKIITWLKLVAWEGKIE